MSGAWMSRLLYGMMAALLAVGCTGSPKEDVVSEEESVASEEDVASEEAGVASEEEAADRRQLPEAMPAEPAPAPRPAAPTPKAPASPPTPPADPEPAPAPPPAREEPPAPEFIELEVPSGTVLELELLTALDSSVNRAGDEIQARTLSPLYVKGEQVLDSGTYVEGRVTEVEASGRVKGRAKLAFTFDRLSTPSGVTKVRTSFVQQEAESGQKKDAAVIGGAAGVGAVVGGILGGKKGAAIGATIGGAGGTGVVLSTKGEEIRLPVGTEINVRLDEPVVVSVPR